MKFIKGAKEEIEKTAVDIIADKINELSLKKGKIIMGIPGGRSAQGIFNRLKQAPVIWGKVHNFTSFREVKLMRKLHIFMVDERFVSLDDKDSNFRTAKESFIDELIEKKLLPKQNVHPFCYNKFKEDGGVKEYEKEFLKYGKAYDIVLLGAGEDGHIASLFPRHHSIKDDSEYFIKVENSPKPPAKRISVSRKLLARTDTCLLLFFGEEKKAAYMDITFRNRTKYGIISVWKNVIR